MARLSMDRYAIFHGLAAFGLGALLCWAVPIHAEETDSNAVRKLEPIVVKDQAWNAAQNEKLAKEVQTALHDDPICYDFHITVVVKDGVVILKGFVVDHKDLVDAVRISKKLPGVKRVQVELDETDCCDQQ
jgi:hypothetical protein